MKYLKVWFADEAFESVPVADEYELPEFEEFDHTTMPLWLRVEAVDGSEIAFPLNTVRRMHVTDDD